MKALSYEAGFLDITGAETVEILIDHSGTKLWVNAPGCCLRICEITGPIVVKDDRPAITGEATP